MKGIKNVIKPKKNVIKSKSKINFEVLLNKMHICNFPLFSTTLKFLTILHALMVQTLRS